MLNMDTLNGLFDLTANTLYDTEVAHLPKLLPAEVEALIVRARRGDGEAREALIVSCLSHALGVARFIYHARRPQHDDLLDLVQVASERMVARLDRALATSAPAAYLRGIGRRAILDYCTYHSGLIDKPEYALAVLEKMNPHPPKVVRLDKTVDSEGHTLVDLIEAKETQPEPDEKQQQKRWAVLYRAIHRLPQDHQEAIIRLYGLYGQPAETPGEIGRQELIRNRVYEARKKLQTWLADDLQQMDGSDVSSEEEE